MKAGNTTACALTSHMVPSDHLCHAADVRCVWIRIYRNQNTCITCQKEVDIKLSNICCILYNRKILILLNKNDTSLGNHGCEELMQVLHIKAISHKYGCVALYSRYKPAQQWFGHGRYWLVTVEINNLPYYCFYGYCNGVKQNRLPMPF